MNFNSLVQYIILALLAILLFTLADPFMHLMPNMLQMVCLTVASALLAVFAGFVISESAGDEREVLHRMHAGRAAFLSGIAVLTTALVYQGFTHSIDIWVPLALLTMILSKLVARWYAERTY